MAASVTHKKVSAKADAADTSLVRPSDWNDTHTVTGLAPDDADYLVGTANAGLSNEIAVGTTPGGELGGTWASPTVDATHSGSTHAAAISTAESYADSADSAHVAAGDPHTGYRLESADHSHASTGLQAGTVAHSVLTGITATDHHVAPAAGPDANVTIDAAGAAGTASTFARSGHGHQLVTSATAGVAVGTAAAGTSGHAPSRDDHVHPTGAGTPSTQAFGDAAATGTGPAAAMTDHKHAMPANPVGAYAEVIYTAGDITLGSGTSMVVLTGPGDCVIAAATGDHVFIGLSARTTDTDADSLSMDCATIVSAAVVNFISSRTNTALTTGVPGWYFGISRVEAAGTVYPYTIAAGDISGGNVTFRLYYRVSGTGKVLAASSGIPLTFWVMNLKH